MFAVFEDRGLVDYINTGRVTDASAARIEALDLLPLIQVAVRAHMITTEATAQRNQNLEANPADQLPERR